MPDLKLETPKLRTSSQASAGPCPDISLHFYFLREIAGSSGTGLKARTCDLMRFRQEDEFKANLGYKMRCLSKTKIQTNEHSGGRGRPL